MHVYMHACMQTHLQTYRCIYTHVYAYKYMYMHTYTHFCWYVYTYMYVCIHTHIRTCVLPHRNKEQFCFFSYQNIQCHLSKAKMLWFHLELTSSLPPSFFPPFLLSFLFLCNRYLLSSIMYQVSVKQDREHNPFLQQWGTQATELTPGIQWMGFWWGEYKGHGAHRLLWSVKLWLPRSRSAAVV